MRLVCLIFADNTAYCKVVEKIPNDVTIDLEKKRWRYTHAHLKQDELIGHSCYISRRFSGNVIGVYDIDDIEQVNVMVRAAVESQRDYSDAD